MYRLEDIKRVGQIFIGGGVVTLLLGLIAQLAVGFEPGAIVINNLIYFALFGIGWFIFNQLVMSSVFNKLVDEAKRRQLKRLDAPLTLPPLGRWGQPFQQIELAFMALWAISVGVVQLLLGQNLSVPIAGVAGGWLVGGGAGRLRFFRIIGREQRDQQRLFYFSDASLGPATTVAYYTDQPDEAADAPVEVPTSSTTANLPPGIKRRGDGLTASTSSPTRRKPDRPGSN